MTISEKEKPWHKVTVISVNSLDSENYKGLLILHCKGRGKSLITAEKYLQEKLFIKVKKKKTKQPVLFFMKFSFSLHFTLVSLNY